MSQTIIVISVLLALIFGPTLLASLWEKRPVWPYSELKPLTLEELYGPADQPPSLEQNSARQAYAAGFRYLGSAVDHRGKGYKTRFHFFVDKTQTVLATIGAGTIFRLPVKGVTLFSRTPGNRAFYSVNDQTGIEKDLTGFWKDQLLLGAPVDKLYEGHLAWLVKTGELLSPFDNGGEMQNLREVRRARFEKLHQLGYSRYLDSSKEVWQYKPWGAVKSTFVNIVIGIFRQIKAGKH